MLSNYIAANGSPNIRVRNLDEIPRFRELKGSILDHKRDVATLRSIPPEERTFEHENIWGRVDLARLLVIDYVLNASSCRDVIYSDFDASDVSLNNPKAQSLLDKHGMLFGLAPSSSTGIFEILENGYMAFRRDRMDMSLFKKILHETEKEVSQGYNGYGPFYKELESWCADRCISDFPSSIGIPLLPSMRHEIPTSHPQPLRIDNNT